MKNTFFQKLNPNKSGSVILLFRLLSGLNNKRKFQLLFAILLILSSGVAELVSLGSVVPFIAIISDPRKIWNNQSVKLVANFLGLVEPSQIIIPTTVSFILVVILASILRTSALRYNSILSASIGSDISCKAYSKTLLQPYSAHVRRNSSQIIAILTSQLGRVVASIAALLQISTSLIVSLFIFVGLFVIDSFASTLAIVVLGTSYLIISLLLKDKLTRNSKYLAFHYRQQVKILQESLGGIRDIILDNNYNFFIDEFSAQDRKQRRIYANNTFLGKFPKFIFETIGICSLALLGFSFAIQGVNADVALPKLAGLALGAQKLLPSLQQIFVSWSTIRASVVDIANINGLLDQEINSPSSKPINKSLQFESIELKNVSFSYGKDAPKILSNINLKIQKGEKIGIIGTTGSGKSTLINIIMGLLEPTEGHVLINDRRFSEASRNKSINIDDYQSIIAHVPQNVFLADRSIADNIAFGTVSKLIDMDKIRMSAEKAQIDKTIQSKSQGFQTLIGERGINLSGGQQQRIALARAFYKDAQIIILDEATSALDIKTESEVIRSIDTANKSNTLITIAHRYATLKNCTKIIKLNQGSIVDIGTYSEIISHIDPK